MSEKPKHPDAIIKFTENMFLDLLKGKDLHVRINAHDPEKEQYILFKGPYYGMFLTYEEIYNLEAKAENSILNTLKKIQDANYDVKSEKKV